MTFFWRNDFFITRFNDVKVHRYHAVNYWEKHFRDEILYSDRTIRWTIGLALMLNYWYSQKGCRINCALRVMPHNQMRCGVVYEHRYNPIPRRIITNYCKRLRAIKLTHVYLSLIVWFVQSYNLCDCAGIAIFAISFVSSMCSDTRVAIKLRKREENAIKYS